MCTWLPVPTRAGSTMAFTWTPSVVKDVENGRAAACLAGTALTSRAVTASTARAMPISARTERRPADLRVGTPDPEAHAPTAVHDAPAEGTHADQADHQEDLHHQGPPVGGVDEGVEAAHLPDRLDRPGRHDDDDRGEGAGRHRAGDGGRVLGTVRLVRPPEEEGGEEGEAAQPDGGRAL